MANKVLGRISTVLAVNAKPLQSGLNLAKGELETFASTVKSRLTSAGNSAERALKGMYTDFQRLERAVKAANSQQLNLKVQNPKAILDVARATERIAKPVNDAQKQFSALSQTVQSALLPVLQSGQKQAENFFDAISRGVKVSERDFANTESRVNRMTEAIRRAAEASQATRGLATGQELRFQNPEFLRSTSRAAQLQQQAAQLSPEAISSRGIVSLIGQQKLAADEAERLRATLERTIATRNGDQESARRAYTQQVAYLDQVNARLERQIQLERQAGEINDNIGASTQLRSTTDPTGRSIQQRSRDIRDARINENVGAFSRRATDVRAYIALLEQERLAQEAVAAAERKRSSEIAGLINREKAALELERERIAAAKKAEEAEQAALNRREQTALRLERQLADDSTQRQQAEQDTLNRREQNALRLERQLADEARRRQDAEQAALNKKEQTALRLERQLADEARRREEAEQAALNRREQTALRLERQLTEEARRRQEDEQAALNRREQTALRLEKQLADAARQRQEAEDQAFQAFIRRQQAAKSLEQNLGGGISPPTPSEVDDTARLINRERARLEAERNRISPPTPDQNDETARLIARERAARDEERMRPSDLTGNRAPRTRVLATLGQEVGDLRNRLRGVGETLAGDIGPTVDNLTTRFQNMARQGVGVAAEEARRLSQEVAGINTALNNRQSIGQQFESSFGGAGRAGLSLGVDERSLRAIGGQIEFVQGRLSALGQEARGPVIAALDALRTRANQLFQGGALDTEEGRRELQLLREELVRTLAAASGGNERRLAEQLNRVGDVARGSFGNAGLAIQQAAFAFEDFFSVTGGLDQRIRAAGNNISQLGFILGGTTGLIFGISAAIGSQLIVALINWSNGGRTAEDQTKSLNDALARQKSLVEDLKQAFESLGDAIADRAFSEPARQARQFQKELDGVAKKQKEQREKGLADLDPYVRRERDEQARIQREMAATSDPETFLRLQRDLQRAQRGERAVTEGLIAGVPRTQRDRDREIAGLEGIFTNVNDRNFRTGGVGRPVAAEQARALIASIQGGSARGQAAQLRDQQQVIDNEARSGRLDRATADNAIAQLQLVINRLDFAATRALDELTISILRASQAASLEIESAQADVADAIRRGVPGAALLQQNLDAIAQEMATAQQRLRDAQESDSPDREQQIRLAQRDIDGIRARQDGIAEASRDIRLTSGRGGERTTAALSALQGNERFANEYGGLIARLRAAVDAEMVARLANEKAMKGGTDAEKEAARAAYESAAAVSDMAAAAAEAALAMEQAVGRIRKIGADALSQSERMADEAQQRLNERPTDENRRRRDEAEQELIRDRQRVALANNALDRRRTELQQSDPRLVQINDELESVRQERRRLSDDAAKNNTTVDPAEAQRLADWEAILLAEREQRLFSLTEAQRRQQDAINQEINARRRLVDFMEEVERRQNPQGDPVRGLDLLERPGERAARELRQSVADIRAATQQNVNRAIREGRAQDVARERQRGREAERRALFDQLRNAAPTIFGLADSVANAVLQGPSRAALQATDVSTVEGSRELTRLLRGDDAARDQANLVELQREANRLLDIIANAPAPVAN